MLRRNGGEKLNDTYLRLGIVYCVCSFSSYVLRETYKSKAVELVGIFRRAIYGCLPKKHELWIVDRSAKDRGAFQFCYPWSHSTLKDDALFELANSMWEPINTERGLPALTINWSENYRGSSFWCHKLVASRIGTLIMPIENEQAFGPNLNGGPGPSPKYNRKPFRPYYSQTYLCGLG